MNKIEEAIIGHWGVRCSEYAPGCPCCEAWAEYDAVRDAALEEAAARLESTADRTAEALQTIEQWEHSVGVALAHSEKILRRVAAAIRALKGNVPPK